MLVFAARETAPRFTHRRFTSKLPLSQVIQDSSSTTTRSHRVEDDGTVVTTTSTRSTKKYASKMGSDIDRACKYLCNCLVYCNKYAQGVYNNILLSHIIDSLVCIIWVIQYWYGTGPVSSFNSRLILSNKMILYNMGWGVIIF